MEESDIWLARVDAWEATVIRCLNDQETREGQGQKLYADTQGKMLELLMAQLAGNAQFLQYFAGWCSAEWNQW